MMPNLSNMLGDVYGPGEDPDRDPAPEDPRGADPKDLSGAEEEQAPEHDAGAAGPDWASDDRLDAAFGDWTAGELPGTDSGQRERLEHLGEDAAAHAEAVEAEVDEAAAEAPVAEAPAPPETPASPPETEAAPAPAGPVEPQVRAVAAGELDRAPTSELAPAPAGIETNDLTRVASPPEPAPRPVATHPPATSQWRRGDDDILPGGGRRGLSRLLGR